MKKFMNLKVQTWELVVVCVILAAVVMRPGWLVQLNQELIGKILLLGALVAASLHKPYMGLLVLLLIVSIGYYREGIDGGDPTLPTGHPSHESHEEPGGHLTLPTRGPSHIDLSHDHIDTSHDHIERSIHPRPSHHHGQQTSEAHLACNIHKNDTKCEQNNCTWEASTKSCNK